MIRLHIERLVLDGLGLNRAEAERVKAGLEAELTRLFGEGHLAPSYSGGGRFPGLELGVLESAASTPEGLGQGIAQRVHGEMGKAE